MSLKENVRYNQISSTVPAGIKAAYKIGGALPAKKSPKTVDVSQFQGIANKVSDYTPSKQTSGLGTTTVPYGGSTRYEKFHPGIDIANKIGTAIKAFTPGTVEKVDIGYKQGDAGYGNSIIVKDAQGNLHRYSHLQQAWVKAGQPIQQGTQLGTMGNTGSTYSTSGGTGSHLDYRVKNIYGKYINPTGYIKQ